MNILFIGKRFYTNRDAYHERFGRIFQLPVWWASTGEMVALVLLDYHSYEQRTHVEGSLSVSSMPVLSRRFSAFLARELIGRGRWQVVVGSGDCYLGLVAWMIARRCGALFMFDVYDRYDLFGAYRSLPFFDLFRFLLRRADLRSFASQALPQLVGARSGADLLIPNGVDTRYFIPRAADECRRALGLPVDGRYAGYFGAMDDDRGVDDLVAAVDGLNRRGQALMLLLAGRNPPERYLGHPYVYYLGDMPFEAMPTVMGCADVLVVPYRRSAMMDQGASCKIAEYLAAGKPLVTTRTPNFLLNFPAQARELGGAVCEPGNPDDLARAIELQLQEPRYTTLPNDFTWEVIASDALSRIKVTMTSSFSVRKVIPDETSHWRR